jgi:RNA polymerase sigma-70 factor (ECF subfamily)
VHVHAAYNLARWLMRDVHDAEDVVQQAMLRACRSFGSFRGEDAQGWLLAIVRNCCYTTLRQHRRHIEATETLDPQTVVVDDQPGPAASLLRSVDREQLESALENLPAPFREVFVLREVEELSYAQIAQIVDIPVGTVMSRLARARLRLREMLGNKIAEEA